MKSDYVDNWDALPLPVQEALEPVIADFDAAADLLFDRRLNLSFEAAVKELSIPGVVALTEGLRRLRALLESRVTVADAAGGALRFDGATPLTVYDLPLYTPCVYLSQLARYMDSQNVRVWKEGTAAEIVQILLVMARCVRPDIETAHILIAALHDMVYLYPKVALEEEQADPNARHIAQAALRLLGKR
ncbi:MAG: hypothetical protein JO250_10975 [Armatimonadetes bacterium]|nr:hypothetical protein [Armatimonadota bacterium]